MHFTSLSPAQLSLMPQVVLLVKFILLMLATNTVSDIHYSLSNICLADFVK